MILGLELAGAFLAGAGAGLVGGGLAVRYWARRKLGGYLQMSAGDLSRIVKAYTGSGAGVSSYPPASTWKPPAADE